MKTIPSLLCLITLIFGLTACQKGPNPDDPYEHYNREIFAFNQQVDNWLVKPLATTYKSALPPPLYQGIDRILSHLRLIQYTANDLLQFKLNDALVASTTFVINSTLGAGGLFKVSTHFGLPTHPTQSFDHTLHYWGWHQSTFIMLPFLGPSTWRDTLALPVDNGLFTPTAYLSSQDGRLPISLMQAIHTRSQNLRLDQLMQQAFDPYIFLRNAYNQRRQHEFSSD